MTVLELLSSALAELELPVSAPTPVVATSVDIDTLE